jgi:hypothetical protein
MRPSRASGSDPGTDDLLKLAARLFNRRRRTRPFWQKTRRSRLERLLARVKSKESLQLLTGVLSLVAFVLVVYLFVSPGALSRNHKGSATEAPLEITSQPTP